MCDAVTMIKERLCNNMKRKLIQRNKRKLSNLLIFALRNDLPLSTAIYLHGQTSLITMISRLQKRGKLIDDWSQVNFEEGYVSVPQCTQCGHIICYKMLFKQSELPSQHQDKWIG